ARRFHSTLVEMIAQTCEQLRRQSKLDAVALCGGVFANALLAEETAARLASGGFRVFRHERVPTNDGGLSFGQAAIGAAVLRARSMPAGSPSNAPSHRNRF